MLAPSASPCPSAGELQRSCCKKHHYELAFHVCLQPPLRAKGRAKLNCVPVEDAERGLDVEHARVHHADVELDGE
eukprot:353108-Chlamydomonas_euryale.AAC.9